MEERLDRAVSNARWVESWPRVAIQHLAIFSSDHNPILVESTSTKGEEKKWGHMYHFEIVLAQ